MDLLIKINHQKNAQRITFEAACALKSQNSIKKSQTLAFCTKCKGFIQFPFCKYQPATFFIHVLS
jgi:hypothetical protein